MRYAIFTDIHANLEALEAVLAKIDELAKEEPIDEIWFLGDLVGYGPNPNECVAKLRERTNVIIAGNHDWAAVGKIDLEDFSEAARISAEWTAEQLSEENRTFLAQLPERLEKGECLLVHGSPYGPLWEYLTSEVLAERSFQQFNNRYCFVGHTHVPIIFQQPDTVANAPTHPLESESIIELLDNEETRAVLAQALEEAGLGEVEIDDDDDTESITVVQSSTQTSSATASAENAHAETTSIQDLVADKADAIADLQQQLADDVPGIEVTTPSEIKEVLSPNESSNSTLDEERPQQAEQRTESTESEKTLEEITPEETIQSAEERLSEEIEELLTLLGLSQSMIEVTNEMIIPPAEGSWQLPEGNRAIINPGGVGQPRDGDSRAAFMIYDTEKGFTFYRIHYPFEKTQEKIIKAGLPPYLATRLAYGR